MIFIDLIIPNWYYKNIPFWYREEIMDNSTKESASSLFMIIVSVLVIIIGLVAMASWAFATYLFASTGYLLAGYHTDYFNEISSDSELNEISQKYFGVNANEVPDYLSKKSEKSPHITHLYANLWSRKTARKAYYSNHTKFVRYYERIAKTVSKIGVPAYNWFMMFGYLGISFLGIIIGLIAWLNPFDDTDAGGGGWYVSSDGSIGTSGGSHIFATLLSLAIFIAIAVFLAPALNLVLSIGIVGFGIYLLVTHV